MDKEREKQKDLFEPYLSNSGNILYFLDWDGKQRKVYIDEVTKVVIYDTPYDNEDVNSIFKKKAKLYSKSQGGVLENAYIIRSVEDAYIIGNLLNHEIRRRSHGN